jgi:putative phosphoesterase
MLTRVGIIGDTHGDRFAIAQCQAAVGQVEAWLHLGDYARDAELLRAEGTEVFSVAGNCDYAGQTERVVCLGGVRIFMAHGHRYGVNDSPARLVARARELHCTVALYGHTHVPLLDEGGDVLVLCPGSPSRPRGGSKRYMGLLVIREGTAEGELVPLCD